MRQFWELGQDRHKIAICNEASRAISYAELSAAIDRLIERLPVRPYKQLGLLLCANELSSIAAYLAGLRTRNAVMLLDAKLDPRLLAAVIERYRPEWICGLQELPRQLTDYTLRHDESNLPVWHRNAERDSRPIHPDLAVLLSTSGTTGSGKFVRLSYRNLQANAESIAAYLRMDETDKAMMTLPMHYSYGLSVINSHLLVQGTLLLAQDSVLSKSFWTQFNEQAATSFSGVPYIYHMLHRLHFDKMNLPSLRYFTQAGGRLATNLVQYFDEAAKRKNCRFYIMYGQTEATARISYVPPERLQEKPESIGVPIPGGRMAIDPASAELIYEGPNVMLGYAEAREDLARGDELSGRLHTGDLASVDGEGFFYITGRMKRFIKLFGLRLNLDDIEKQLEQRFELQVACLGQDDRLDICIVDGELLDEVKRHVHDIYKLHYSAYFVHVMPELPRMENGKLNYTELKEMIR